MRSDAIYDLENQAVNLHPLEILWLRCGKPGLLSRETLLVVMARTSFEGALGLGDQIGA